LYIIYRDWDTNADTPIYSGETKEKGSDFYVANNHVEIGSMLEAFFYQNQIV
jgi:hypothetical protein